MEQLVDNRYEIVKPLGSGGMADVFLAHDSVLDRSVALKVMNSRYARDEEFVERFRREAQSAAALSHPNIVSIYDRGGSEDGTYYIAMEYLPGGTLKDRVLKKGALPPKTAAEVAKQIAEALRAAHDRGVVHRDIKPHNILITEAGDIKVTDFGIARAASSSTMTKTGAVMGTAHYISPEQAMGESVGPASDLYSLGVVLYEMLTGELPFDADTPIGIAMKHVNGTPPPPKEINPAVPAGLNAIVVRLLQKDPANRYASDTELIEDLERVAQGESPTSAAATQVMEKLERTGEFAPAAVPPTDRMPRTQREAPKNGRGRRLAPLLLVVLLLALLGVGGAMMLGNLLGGPSTNNDPNAAQVEVPDLTGLTLQEARQEVGDRFEISEADTQNSPEQEGTIIEQDPASGGTLAEGSEIEVTTASGTNAVPDVVNEQRQQAVRQVEDAGFEVRIQERESEENEAGQVLSQNPGGGSNQEVGSRVTLTVGAGVDTVTVPDIPYGSTEAQSRSILEDANLTLGSVTTEASAEIEEGTIISQNPLAGEEVEQGSAVDIVLSSGPEQVTVPDVVGDDLDSALATLQGLGLGYTPVGVESSEPEGTVISTDPAGGTTIDLDQDAIVTVTYSLGQASPVVPEQPSPSPSQPPSSGNDSNNGSPGGGNDSDNNSGSGGGSGGGSGSGSGGGSGSGSGGGSGGNNAGGGGSGGGGGQSPVQRAPRSGGDRGQSGSGGDPVIPEESQEAIDKLRSAVG